MALTSVMSGEDIRGFLSLSPVVVDLVPWSGAVVGVGEGERKRERKKGWGEGKEGGVVLRRFSRQVQTKSRSEHSYYGPRHVISLYSYSPGNP